MKKRNGFNNFFRKLDGRPEVKEKHPWSREDFTYNFYEEETLDSLDHLIDLLEDIIVGTRDWECIEEAFAWARTNRGFGWWSNIACGNSTDEEYREAESYLYWWMDRLEERI